VKIYIFHIIYHIFLEFNTKALDGLERLYKELENNRRFDRSMDV